MAKKIYFGVGGKARKVKKVYVGIGGKARRVKRAYVGVGGKARLFWTGGGGEVLSHTTATGLLDGGEGIENPVSAYNDKYCIIGTGHDPSYSGSYSGISQGIAWNPSLTETEVNVRKSAESVGAIGTNTHFIFAGGYQHRHGTNSAPTYSSVTAFDNSLTILLDIADLSNKKKEMSTVNIGNRSLFAGGNTATNLTMTSVTNNIDVYDSSLTKGTTLKLDTSKRKTQAVGIGNYAIITGGCRIEENERTTNCFNASLTRTMAADLPASLSGYSSTTPVACAAKAGNYALFHNGSKLMAYNQSLTLTSRDETISGADGTNDYGTGVSWDEYVFVLGYAEGNSNASWIYDGSLTRQSAPSSNYPTYGEIRYRIGGRIANHIIYGGCYRDKADPSEVFTVS